MGSDKPTYRDANVELGPYIFKRGDKSYFDATSGFLQCPLGHDPILMQTVLSSVATSSSFSLLEDTLHQVASERMTWRFTSSHSMAVEAAITSALTIRQRTLGKTAKRVMFISGGYHGHTISTGAFHLSMECFRRPFDVMEVFQEEILGETIPTHIMETDFDAFIIEPVQRMSGFVMTDTLIKKVSDLCKANGSYLIVDESISSFGRCNSGLSPSGMADIVVLGEQIAQGLLIGAVGLDNELFPSDFETEFGWPFLNPVVCNAANNILKRLCIEGVYDRSCELGRDWAFILPDGMARSTGSLIHLNLGPQGAVKVWQKLFDIGVITMVQGAWLSVAPCYTMPREVNEYLIETVKEVIDEWVWAK